MGRAEKVLLIVGMGPEIGLAMAHRFGREGYAIAMISRNGEKLRGYASDLAAAGIATAWRAADVLDRPALGEAIAQLEAELGRIDVLEYSPLLDMAGLVGVLDLTAEQALEQIEFQLLGAIASAKAALPGMIARGDGALLFTTGASAYVPAPSHANGSLGVRALRHYALTLGLALKRHGVYVGTVSIGRPHSGAEIAERYWNMTQARDHAEELLGDPRLMAAYEELVALGLGETYPASFIGDLPPPADERERNIQLVSIYHVHQNKIAFGASHQEIDAVAALVPSRGGNIDLPLYGATLDEIRPPFALR